MALWISDVKIAQDRAPESDPANRAFLPGGCHDPVQALDGVGVQLDPAIGQEDAQAIPVAQHVADRLGHRHLAGDARQLLFQVDLERLDPGPAAVLTNRPPGIGRLAADRVLDAVQLGDPPEHLAGDRRLAGLVDLEELPTAVRPAEGEGDGARIIRDGVLFAGQPLEAAPAVDLQHAGVVGQHLAGAVPDPVLGVDVGHRRRQVALPGAVVPGEAPEIAGPGPALAGRQHRQARVVAEQLGRTQHAGEQQLPQRLQPPCRPAHPVRQGGAVEMDAVALQDLGLAVQRQAVVVLRHRHLGQQRLRSAGRRGSALSGAGACTTASAQLRQP